MLFKSQTRAEQIIALILVAAGVILRMMPHADNFAPTTALAIFSGAVLPPSIAFTVPLFIMMISDLWIGPHSLFWLIWLTFSLVTWVGYRIRLREGVAVFGLASAAGSVIFFIISNLGVFLFENMYPKNLNGLYQCFVMALPFFRNALMGDLFYSLLFYFLFTAARSLSRTPQKI